MLFKDGKLFGREPTLWLAVVNAAILLLGTFGFHYLTTQEAVLICGLITAIVGCINAYAVRPISPVAFTYAVGAFLAVLAAYGFHVSTDTAAALDSFIVFVLALLSRGQVTPVPTPVSSPTGAPVV